VLGIPLRQMVAEAYLPGFALAAVVLALACTLNLLVAPSSPAGNAIVATLSAATACAGLIWMGPRGWTARLRMRRA
jgi:hypothetical protein